MLKLASRLLKDESGAVTVDWVVLTAAIVALNVALVISLIEGGMVEASNKVNGDLSTAIEQ